MKPTPRLWPAYTILLLLALSTALAWLTGDGIRQYRVLQTLVSALLAGLLLLLWLAFFSRLPGRLRLALVAGVLLLTGLAGSLFRVRGVSGDLAPIVDFRWSTSAPPPLPSAPPAELPADAPGPQAVREAGPPGGGGTPGSEEREARRADTRAAGTGALVAASPLAKAPAPAWPQFLGPNRDATLYGPALHRDWTARPPRLVWRQAIGAGWSSFAIVDGLAITQEQRGEDELVVAYDLATGGPRWSHADRARYDNAVSGLGPRATPTVALGRVFTQGATGILNALDLRTGRKLWSRQVIAENGASEPAWGKSPSPLVHGDRVIVSAGGTGGRSLVAYDVATGEPVWAGGSDRGSYSSPQLMTIAGREQVVILGGASVAGHDPATGAVLWEHPWPGEQPTVAQPLPLPGDRLLLSAGYGVGSKVIAVAGDDASGFRPTLIWETPRLKSKFASLLLHGGFVYGLDDGVLTCLDPAHGERRWKAGRYGHGQLVLVGDLLLVQTEEGEVVLVDPTPEGHRELTRAALLDGKTWNPPALSGARLLVRNDREAALYELPLAE